MRRSPPNMRTIAAEAGVCVATVSLALRGHPSLPEETRTRIQEVAARLGYRTNPLVSALMSSRAQRKREARVVTIACLVFDDGTAAWDTQPVFRRMYRGAADRAADMGYRLDKFRIRVPDENPEKVRKILRNRGILAVLLAPLPGHLTHVDFDFSGFAALGIGMSVQRPTLDRVANDHFQSSVLAFRKCVEAGYRRIGLLVDREVSLRLDQRWLAGYLVAQLDVPAAQRLVPLQFSAAQPLQPQFQRWYTEQKPDVVITSQSYASLPPAITAKAPIVLLSRDDAPPEIPGIDQDAAAIGSAAVDYLLARLQRNEFGPAAHPRLHAIPGHWVDGKPTP